MNSTYTKHPSKRWYLVTGIIALILVIVLCAACGSNVQTSGEATPPPASTESVESTTSASDGELRGDFKEAMGSYEDFMKKYKSNPSDVSLLADYADYMTKYADMVDKFDKWESEDLSDAELAYYIDVQARVSKLLIEASQSRRVADKKSVSEDSAIFSRVYVQKCIHSVY